jgi:SAM-dependent methyltransferase
VAPKDVTEFYDEFSEAKAGIYLGGPAPRLEEVWVRLKPLLLERAPRAALDIGCGIGVLTDRVARTVPRVVGVDISPRAIEIAREISANATYAVTELPSGPLPDGPFDLVTLVDALEHFQLDARSALFARIGELISDDAVVAINIPSKLFQLRMPAHERQVIDEAVGVDEVVALAATIGMEPLTVQRYGIGAPNEYVFCAFSRTYDVEGPPPRDTGPHAWLVRLLGHAVTLRNRVRYARRHRHNRSR